MFLLENLITSNKYLVTNLYANNSLSNIKITGVTANSTKCKPGYLFVAKSGATPKSRDGHDYIEQALDLGASAIIIDSSYSTRRELSIPVIRAQNSSLALAYVCEAFWGFPSQKIKLIGLTGTNGKTSTSFMLHSIFTQAGYNSRIMGTLGMGEPNNLISLSHTTMEPEFISENLANMCAEQVSHVILEVSSHGLVLDRASALNFAAVGLTNISQDHLDFHGSMQEYINSKQILFDKLAQENTYKILPNNHSFNKSVEKLKNIIFYDPAYKPPGLKLLGDFQANNSSLALSIASSMGIKHDEIILGLQNCVPVPGRFELVAQKPCKIFVDYAHTPDALENILRSARNLGSGRVILVFGCAGDRDQKKRPMMGAIAQKLADIIIITDDNPRSENPEKIRQEIISALSNLKFHEIADRKQAIQKAILEANPNDIIIIAGKGHENYQIYNNNNTYFSDHETVKKITEIL